MALLEVDQLNVRFHTPNALHIREITRPLARLMKRAGFHTITAFANHLSDHGLVYSDQAIGHWEMNRRVPERDVVLRVLAALAVVVFHYHHFYLADQMARPDIPARSSFPYASLLGPLFA